MTDLDIGPFIEPSKPHQHRNRSNQLDEDECGEHSALARVGEINRQPGYQTLHGFRWPMTQLL
jgi:hypothetical protein